MPLNSTTLPFAITARFFFIKIYSIKNINVLYKNIDTGRIRLRTNQHQKISSVRILLVTVTTHYSKIAFVNRD